MNDESQNGDVKLSLKRIGVVLAALTAALALAGSFIVLPYRMQAAETRINTLEMKLEAQRDLLSRIDENVKILIKERNR